MLLLVGNKSHVLNSRSIKNLNAEEDEEEEEEEEEGEQQQQQEYRISERDLYLPGGPMCCCWLLICICPSPG